MARRKSNSEIGATTEFRDGCQVFLEYAYSHPICINEKNQIRCPCLRCKNNNYLDIDIVNYHLLVNGFMRDYEKCWWAHGQRRDGGFVVHNPGNSSTHRMNEMVHDIAGPDFDWEQGREQAMNSEVKDFFKLLDEGSEPLWDGCTKQSKLSAVATLLNIKADHNMSHECFESLLKAIKSMLPDSEKLPDNYYYCKKMVKKLGLGYQKIDACPNDCMLFYKENEKMTRCTVCGHDRFRLNKDGVTTKKSTIPFKILRYFPLTDRLKRLYMSSRTAQHMSWHGKSSAKDGELNHPADGKAWKDFNLAHLEFSLEPRNVRLGLSTDGFNPFGHSSIPYSCWPVIVTPYNLPSWMCMKQPYLFLSLMIPGPKSPGKNLDVYLRPLIDELKVLWKDGVQTWDVATKTNFNLRAALMWTISDFPAYGMLCGWSTHGKLACPYCMERTKSFTLSKGRKPCWFDCHRRFLPPDHPFRRNRATPLEALAKRYRWADEQGPAVSSLFWQKCAARTKDNLSKDRDRAIHNANIDHPDPPGSGVLYMHEYSPWWCSPDIWAQMCDQWRDDKWMKKRSVSRSNRYAGVPEGEKAKGTYKGGSISQLQHISAKESQSQGTPINCLDVYVATRDGLPEAQNIAEKYRRLFNERYPEGTDRPDFDQELWVTASTVKKNYIKGQAQQRRPSIYGSGSTQSSQIHPSYHTPADCVRAICQNPALLLTLAGHLGALDPEELARAVAAATASQQKDGEEGSHHQHHDQDEHQDQDDEFGPF